MHNEFPYQLLVNVQPSAPGQHPSPPLRPQFLRWTWCHRVWSICLPSLGQLSQLCRFPILVPPQPPCRQGRMRSWRILDHCLTKPKTSVLSTVSSSQIQTTALCQLLRRKLTLCQLKPRHWFPSFQDKRISRSFLSTSRIQLIKFEIICSLMSPITTKPISCFIYMTKEYWFSKFHEENRFLSS